MLANLSGSPSNISVTLSSIGINGTVAVKDVWTGANLGNVTTNLTRWYIGWGVPVPFSEANQFARKFYSTWCNKYDMSPDKVKDAFDAIQGSFWKWRPRLFGS